ncbi:MAG: DNA polymerase III subunit gamma/tau, partial [Oscillochloris sp.]|nr:DNA polymerase III subunit gamma/tau [Oscillochloris sp.]
AEMRSKGYINDEVHKLSTAAFNALLKTLEEPPDHAIFIMATTEVHKIPATILSRCQRFTFTRHGVAATSVHLRQIAAAEGLELETGAPEAIARAATGSMRDALSVLEQLASFGQGVITLEQVHSLLGMTAAAEVNALIESLLNRDVGAALRAVNGVADQGADIRQFTRDLVERLRALMLFRATGDRSLLDVGEDELRTLEEWGRRADSAALVEWIKLFSGLDFQLRTTSYGHLPLELTVVEALVGVRESGAGRADVGGRRREAEGGRAEPSSMLPVQKTPAPLTPVAAPVPSAEASPPAAAVSVEPPTAVSDPETAKPALASRAALPARNQEAFIAANADFTVLERIEALWEDIKRDVRPRSTTVQALLNSIRPIDVEGNTIVLLANSQFHKDGLEKPLNLKIVEGAINKRLGTVFAIRCTIESKAETRDLRGQIRDARNDELVRAAMNIFDAHIVDIEPEG